MTSSKLIGIAFAILVAFSVACAVYIYVQQKRIYSAEQSSQVYQAEKRRMLDQIENSRAFREKLVDEALQHRKAIDNLKSKLEANARALRVVREPKQDDDTTDPLNEGPETPLLRQRVALLETTVGEHEQENRLLQLALTKSESAIEDAVKLNKLETDRSTQLAKNLKREKRRKILFAIGGAIVGAGLGAGAVAIAAAH